MSTDLVARAVPCAIPASNALKDDEGLVEDLKKLSLQSNGTNKKEKKAMRTLDTISPADYVTLQSLRSSALARKTNTTSKFTRDGANLFSDLLQIDEPQKKEEKEKKTDKSESDGEKTPTECSSEPESTKKDEDDKKEEKSDGELLPRGPVRSTRTPVTFHPYGGNKNIPYGTAPQTVVDDVSGYNGGYNYDYLSGQSFYNHDLVYSNSSTPDTVISDTGYSSATSPQGPYQQNYYQHPTSYYHQYPYPSNIQPASSTQSCSDAGSPQANIPFNDRNLTSSDLNRLLSTNNDEDNELPESLSDFILKYSRRYKNEDFNGQKCAEAECSASSNNSSPRHYQRPSSTDSGCDSPLSAVSAPQTSPAQPRGGISGPSTPNNDRLASNTGPVGNQPRRIAKEKLRSLIRDDDMDQAWAWTCKCMMYFPGALSYQDPDRDTLLHIVTRLMDWAKIFTLVERMIKMDNQSNTRMFDMPNKMNETPLFLAVEKGCPEIVEYLLEAGANPNIQTSRPERDAPLHYAAARGMTSIVNILCSHPRIDINGLNGMGLTALLCAVKTHGVLDEESQSIIDSRPAIQALLAYGADPAIPDATNGKTVIHYAVDRLDQSLIEVFMNNISDEAMTALTNKPDLCNETPLKALQCMHSVDEQIRSALCLTLITCGASNQNQQNDYQQSY